MQSPFMDIVVAVYSIIGNVIIIVFHLEYYAYSIAVVHKDVPYVYTFHKIALEYQLDAKIWYR